MADLLIRPYSEPISMGLSFKGIMAIIGDRLRADSRNGDWFLFFNKKRDYLKAFRFDGTKFHIHACKLERGQFDTIKTRTITREQFYALLEGGTLTTLADKPKKRAA